MAEPIFLRVHRILNGRIEDVVDRMERSGSDSVMREAVREVDRAIDQVRGDHEAVSTSRLQAVRQQKMLGIKACELTEKARYAVAEGRDDLAEAALNRQIDLEEQSAKLEPMKAQAAEDEARLGELLAALKSRKREMEDARAAFAAASHPTEASEHLKPSSSRDVERRVAQAEQAFDRAMPTVGGYSRADADTTMRVAEINVLQKRSLVAARLADLKKAS